MNESDVSLGDQLSWCSHLSGSSLLGFQQRGIKYSPYICSYVLVASESFSVHTVRRPFHLMPSGVIANSCKISLERRRKCDYYTTFLVVQSRSTASSLAGLCGLSLGFGVLYLGGVESVP